MRSVDLVLWVLLGVCLATSAWIDLELVRGEFNVPIADLAALIAAAVFGIDALVRHGPRGLFGRLRLGPAGSGTTTAAAIAFPAPLAYALFLLVSVAGLVESNFYPEFGQWFVRKSLFTWMVYGGALAAVVARVGRPGGWHAVALVAALCMALPCLWAAVPPLLRGWASTPWPVPHLASNHKALAVALAPLLPFLWAGRERRGRIVWAVLAISLAAIAASMSKTAWMTAAFGLLAVTPFAGRPLATRPGWALAAVGALAVAMIGLPFVSGNPHMLDAFDSRMSLNLRAWTMFSTNPWVGAGPGSSTVWLMFEAPHWRINGVDAHGVVQKIAAEQGLLGLITYGAFAGTVVVGLWRAAFSPSARPEPLEIGACAMGLALFANLLFSTEAFTSSHWAPLAVALGLARIASTRATPADDVPIAPASPA